MNNAFVWHSEVHGIRIAGKVRFSVSLVTSGFERCIVQAFVETHVEVNR